MLAKEKEEVSESWSTEGRRLVGGEGGVALNTAEHRGVVVGGCIAYSTPLEPIIYILISHTLLLPPTNLRTYIHLRPL